MNRPTSEATVAPSINLTAPHEPGTITLSVSQLLTYSEQTGFTRLRLVGGRTLDVKETTDQIDRLVRTAVAQRR